MTNPKSITSLMSGECLAEAMEMAQELCTVGHGIRAKNNIRIRQPLPEMKIVDPEGKWSWLAFAKDMVEVIKDEINAD